jgi:hypothetical protein
MRKWMTKWNEWKIWLFNDYEWSYQPWNLLFDMENVSTPVMISFPFEDIWGNDPVKESSKMWRGRGERDITGKLQQTNKLARDQTQELTNTCGRWRAIDWYLLADLNRFASFEGSLEVTMRNCHTLYPFDHFIFIFFLWHFPRHLGS